MFLKVIRDLRIILSLWWLCLEYIRYDSIHLMNKGKLPFISSKGTTTEDAISLRRCHWKQLNSNINNWYWIRLGLCLLTLTNWTQKAERVVRTCGDRVTVVRHQCKDASIKLIHYSLVWRGNYYNAANVPTGLEIWQVHSLQGLAHVEKGG